MTKFWLSVFTLSLILFPTAGSTAPSAPLTQEQFQLQKQYDQTAKAEHWLFQYDVRNATKVGKEWGLGYEKKPVQGPVYVLGGGEKLKSWDIDNFPHEHTPTLDQRDCGSCVVFSFDWNFETSLRLRGYVIPPLSKQHLMNCGTGGQCQGAYGEQVAQDLVNLKTLYSEADYPYTAKSGTCKVKTGQRYGQIDSYKTIDGSVQSILSALHNGQPVSVGIAAGGSFGSYTGGVYSACDYNQVNHYVVIKGVDCGTAVDTDGNCLFDAKGNLPPGQGTFRVKNSWGDSFGDKGEITMKITKANGQRCLQIAAAPGDAQILDIGVPMPEDKPVTFVLENASVSLTATVKPASGYGVDAAKKALKNAINSVGVQ